MLRVLSLGAGVQSTTLCLMAARGDIDAPDFAVFADTGGEPQKVYTHLEWLESVLPFPVIRAKRPGSSLGQMALDVASGARPRSGAMLPPFFTKGPEGMLPKQCSKEFKTRVVQRVIRERLGIPPGQRGPAEVVCTILMGISIDEAWRVKPSEKAYLRNIYPLIEAGMNRRQCEEWMQERQYPKAPKSSCIFCTFRTNDQWADMRENEPEEFAEVVAIDKAIRPGWPGMQGQAFLHRQRVPLDEAFLTSADAGQGELPFGEECEGFCGV